MNERQLRRPHSGWANNERIKEQMNERINEWVNGQIYEHANQLNERLSDWEYNGHLNKNLVSHHAEYITTDTVKIFQVCPSQYRLLLKYTHHSIDYFPSIPIIVSIPLVSMSVWSPQKCVMKMWNLPWAEKASCSKDATTGMLCLVGILTLFSLQDQCKKEASRG